LRWLESIARALAGVHNRSSKIDPDILRAGDPSPITFLSFAR
jgi:hypothetical protein